MNRTRIKICGICNSEDAVTIARMSCDAIGLNFYHESPRFVDTGKAREICSKLPVFITKVGLFVNARAQYISEVLAQVPLNVLQFHGDETDDFCINFNMPFIKAIAVAPGDNLDSVSEKIANYPNASAILLDTYHEILKGGSGLSFDWNLIPEQYRRKIILAGGLTPENVGSAISLVKPFAVDVSSGVEKTKAVKDIGLVSQFIETVYLTDAKIYHGKI